MGPIAGGAMGRDSCWTTLLQVPASVVSWTPSQGVLPMVWMEGICTCGHGVWQAEQQTDTSSAIAAQAFQSPLVRDVLCSGLQTPFPALCRQSLSQGE